MSTVPYTHIKNLYIDGAWAKAHGDEAVLNAMQVDAGGKCA
jgi:hypothetical protein